MVAAIGWLEPVEPLVDVKFMVAGEIGSRCGTSAQTGVLAQQRAGSPWSEWMELRHWEALSPGDRAAPSSGKCLIQSNFPLEGASVMMAVLIPDVILQCGVSKSVDATSDAGGNLHGNRITIFCVPLAFRSCGHARPHAMTLATFT